MLPQPSTTVKQVNSHILFITIFTLHVRHSQGKMYIGHGHLCVCLSVSLSVPCHIPTLLHGPLDLDVT